MDNPYVWFALLLSVTMFVIGMSMIDDLLDKRDKSRLAQRRKNKRRKRKEKKNGAR